MFVLLAGVKRNLRIIASNFDSMEWSLGGDQSCQVGDTMSKMLGQYNDTNHHDQREPNSRLLSAPQSVSLCFGELVSSCEPLDFGYLPPKPLRSEPR